MANPSDSFLLCPCVHIPITLLGKPCLVAGDARRWPLDWYRKHFPRTAEPKNEELTTATRAGKEVTGIALALAASYLRLQTTKRGRQSHAEVGC